MTRNEYKKHLTCRSSSYVGESNVLPSVADPTQAQSGRDLVFNPKPIVNNRITYAAGVLAAEMQPFDKMYAEKLDVFSAAQKASKEARSKIESFKPADSQESVE